MPQTIPTVVRFKGMEADDTIRESIEKRCDRLGQEFHEISRLEVTLEEGGEGYMAHGRAGGKMATVDSHASAPQLPLTVDQVLERLERQLRRIHDKRIFARRREARRDPIKRSEPN